ncbi:Hypothetical predicted protein [Pelobates cultripes]|uniref:Endonuclease/exonuclease/phosphatase domain-containing protein n=1 Tax=Pelobates cultripes TaxID=61616 RepID=A0AAD1TS36_PELCU|nr:Hypothetical predicted protein [Pelobates cultripes]
MARFLVYDHLSQAPYNVILVQETRLETLAALHAAKVIELQKGRCVVIEVSLGRQPLRIINIYGPQTKWERERLFSEIEPYLYTSQQVLFGGDFNTITRPQDRRGAIQRLGYDSIFLNNMVSQAGLVDVYLHHTPNPTGGYTYHRGTCQSRIDRFFFKENFPVTAPMLTPVEFSDHHILSCELNVHSTPPKGRGIWRLNSDLLVEQRVQQAFMEFFHDQMTLANLGQTKSEWWEMVKARTRGLFRSLARNMQSSRYKMYLSLLGRLEVLILQGGDPEDTAAVKALMRSYQYDRYASLVKERDHGSYHSPNPYLSCKRKEGTKTISGLRGTDGFLEESPHGILKVVHNYYMELIASSPSLSIATSFDELISEITIEEVTESIHQQNKCKSPGPDGLTAEFYQQFCDLLAPHLTEVFNESLARELLPPSILLTKPNVLDTADVGNWRPISLLNVDRKVLAKIMMKRVQGLARRVLSTSQYCTIGGRTVFDAVFEGRDEHVAGVARAPERPLRVVFSDTGEATEVDDLILAYSAASTSCINRDKSGVFWGGKKGDQFPLPDSFPRAQSEIKILGVMFGPGDLALRNWSERLAIASSKVEESHSWKLTYRERVKLIKTYVLTVFV